MTRRVRLSLIFGVSSAIGYYLGSRYLYPRLHGGRTS